MFEGIFELPLESFLNENISFLVEFVVLSTFVPPTELVMPFLPAPPFDF